MIIDSHCHLDYPALYNNLDKVIDRAKHNNVRYLLTICTTLQSFDKIELIVEKYNNVYGTFGIHPHETKDHMKINSQFILNHVNKNAKIIGIGETGLDFYYNHSDKKTQIKSFIEHIYAASELNLPIIVHTRNAENDTYQILKDEIKNSKLKILIHCFSGSKNFANKLIDLGCYISFSGIITFKNSIKLVNTASSLPIERILVETDSPYLSPVPFRGKSNEPSYIKFTIEKLSEIKKIPINNIMDITTNNFIKLFNLNINEN